MTTLSIEYLKAWLELLPKVTPGPYTYGSKYLCRYREGMYYERIAQALENEEDSPRWNTDAAHLAKCDPATIAALIEGYIAMTEAIEKARIALAEYACHSGEPCARTPEQCRGWCGKAAGDAILIVDAALNIGGTND